MSKKRKNNQLKNINWLTVSLIIAIVITNVFWAYKFQQLDNDTDFIAEQAFNSLIQDGALKGCISGDVAFNDCQLPKWQNINFDPKN